METVLWQALLLYSFAICAAENAVGEYITDGGWGTPNVTKVVGRSFLVGATGANGQSCTLRGALRHGRATLKVGDLATPSAVTFMPRIDGIVVGATTSEICREFRAARATFEGTYLRSPATCTRSQLRRARAKFKSQYDQSLLPLRAQHLSWC
jgi:phage tail tape-measure protein